MIRIRRITHQGELHWAVTSDLPLMAISHKDLKQAISGWRRYRPLRRPRLVGNLP